MTNVTQDDLKLLWDSTLAFFGRFEKPTIESQLRAFWEEVGEFYMATEEQSGSLEAADIVVTLFGLMVAFDETPNFELIMQELVVDREFRDEVVYASDWSGVMIMHGVPSWVTYVRRGIVNAIRETTAEAVHAVARKNNRKTRLTHYINSKGKIARRDVPLAVNGEFPQDVE